VSVTDTTPVDLAATGSSAVVPEYWDTADGRHRWRLGAAWPRSFGTIYLVDMICTPLNWNPSSACPNNNTVIATATYSGPGSGTREFPGDWPGSEPIEARIVGGGLTTVVGRRPGWQIRLGGRS